VTVAYINVLGCDPATVDSELFDYLNSFHWRAHRLPFHRSFYAATFRRIGGRQKTIYMHRLVINAPPRVIVDHIDMNGLNNARTNLRTVTGSQNQLNCVKRSGCVSQYKGVTWDITRQKWQARCTLNGRTKNLGRFDTESEAALAYNRYAIANYGTCARLNEVSE
jgi:AP2 domain